MDLFGDPSLSLAALHDRLDDPGLTAEDRDILTNQWVASMIQAGTMHILDTVLRLRECPQLLDAVLTDCELHRLTAAQTHARIESAFGLPAGSGATAMNIHEAGIAEQHPDAEGHDMVVAILERLGVDAGEKRRTLTLATDLLTGASRVPDDLADLEDSDRAA